MSRDPKDFYETPDEALYPIMSECITNEDAASWERVLDLGCGDGRLGIGANGAHKFAGGTGTVVDGIESDEERALQASANGMTVYATELENCGRIGSADLVISNPPFSAALEFLQYALAYHRESGAQVLFLLPLGYMASQGRHAFWKANPPDAIRVHSKRLSFTGDGKTANADYGWFGWGGALHGVDFYL